MKMTVTDTLEMAAEDGKPAAALEISPETLVFKGDVNGRVPATEKELHVRMRVGGSDRYAVLTHVEVNDNTRPSGIVFETRQTVTTTSNSAPSSLGTLRYRVGLISDPHYNVDGDDTEFSDDIENAMTYFNSLGSMAFVACCGDMCEGNNEDMVMFTRLWANKAKVLNGGSWPSGGKTGFQLIKTGTLPKSNMRLLCCMGNHDVRQVMGQTSNAYNDPRTANKWTSIARLKYNPSQDNLSYFETTWEDEGQKPGLTAADSWNNEFGNSTNRDLSVGELREYIGDNGDDDIWFLGFDDIWAPNAGWGTYNRLNAANNNGWSTRSIRSKTSFYYVKDNDVFVFLSADYGTDPNIDQCWRFDHAINLLDTSNTYFQQVENYVITQENSLNDPNKYSRASEYGFNYQFYDCRALLWLEKIIREQTDAGKRIFVFSHHYFPHKAGNGRSSEHTDGGTGYYCSQNHIRPHQNPMSDGWKCGSYDLCGVQFHFLNVLNRKYPKTVWFSGHSHFIWDDKTYDTFLNFCNKDFDYKKPTANDSGTNYNGQGSVPAFYTRTSDDPVATTAWNVHLPSLSRPKTLSTGVETRKGSWSQGAVMEVYDNYVKIIGLSFKDDGSGSSYRSTPRVVTSLIIRKSDGAGWVDGGTTTTATARTLTPLTIDGTEAVGTITSEGEMNEVEGVLTVNATGTFDGESYSAEKSVPVTVIPAQSGGESGAAAVVYSIIFDSFSALYNVQTKSFRCSFGCHVLKTVGSGQGSIFSGGSVQFKPDTRSSWSNAGEDSQGNYDDDTLFDGVTMASAPGSVFFRFMIGGTVYASAAMPVSITGESGTLGKFCVPAGTFREGTEYKSNELQTVFVEYGDPNNGQVEIFVLNASTNKGSGGRLYPPLDANGNLNSAYWTRGLNAYNLIRAQYLFADFAKLGSGVVCGDWLISKQGTVNGVWSEAYTKFDPALPNVSQNGSHTVNGVTWSGYNFIPQYAVDLLTGRTYQNDAYIRGNIFKPYTRITSSNFSSYVRDSAFVLPGTGQSVQLEYIPNSYANSNGNYSFDLPYLEERNLGCEFDLLNLSGKSIKIYGRIIGSISAGGIAGPGTTLTINHGGFAKFKAVKLDEGARWILLDRGSVLFSGNYAIG